MRQTRAADLSDDAPLLPQPVQKCLGTPQATGLRVLADSNPFYLRGDLFGTGRIDYVLRVSTAAGGIGVLVCRSTGSAYRLGLSVSGRRMSDMPGDKFLSPKWSIYTSGELASLWNLTPRSKGEIITFIWEDGVGCIYWDGVSFRWVAKDY